MEQALGALVAIPTLRTVADAVRIVGALDRVATEQALGDPSAPRTRSQNAEYWHSRYLQAVWAPEFARLGAGGATAALHAYVDDQHRMSLLLRALHSAIPEAWRVKSDGAPATEPEVAAAVRVVLKRLGWFAPPGAPAGVPATALRGLKVRSATALQLGPVHLERQSRHAAYVAEALQLPAATPAPEAQQAEFAALLAGAWKLRWENEQKEVLWRVAVDGVRGGNSRLRPFKCPCSGGDALELELAAGCSPRAHCFDDCAVARAVHWEVERTLLASTIAQPLTRACLWLAQPPAPSVHAGVWQVVCMAALSAMAHGRRQAWRLHYTARREADRAAAASAARYGPGTLMHFWRVPPPPLPPAPAAVELVAEAGRLAVLDFWGRLADLCALGKGLKGWAGHVGVDHPFISLSLRGHMKLRR
jgi:hypothetical protein